MKFKQAWLGLIISAGFLYLAFRESDWRSTWQVLQTIHFGWVFFSLIFLFIAFWLRAVRWRLLLLPAGKPSLHSVFGAIMIGFMSLNLLPFRLGEFIRAYVLGRRENMSKSGVFATVIIERVFDGFSVLLLLLASLYFLPIAMSPEISAWIRAFTILGAVIYTAAAVFVILAKVKTEFLIRALELIFSPLPRLQIKVADLLRSFVTGLDVLKNGRILLMVFVHSILIWLAIVMYYWLVMFGFQTVGGTSLGGQVGFVGTSFVLCAIALGIMIPSSPGFVGTFELAAIASLAALGVDQTVAESYAIVAHVTQFVPITLAGIIYLYRQNFSFREIRTEGKTAKAELHSRR